MHWEINALPSNFPHSWCGRASLLGMKFLFFLGHLLLLSSSSVLASALEQGQAEGQLGEKSSPLYAGPWRPQRSFDPYFGRVSFDDEQFYGGFFFSYIWKDAPHWSRFFSQELIGASTCPHATLGRYFDELRYGHRLLALSYLLEAIDIQRAELVRLKKGALCELDVTELLKTCRPKSENMKTFLASIREQQLYSAPVLHKTHNFVDFEREWVKRVNANAAAVSVQRTLLQCRLEGGDCRNLSADRAGGLLARACDADKKAFAEICSEEDQLYGVSSSPLSTYLLGTSNLMALINDEGQAHGCLRRFGQVMAPKERSYPVLTQLSPAIFAAMKETYQERYPLGRAFVYGALKEYRLKGLGKVFEATVVERPVAVAPVEAPSPVALPGPAPKEEPVVATAPVVKPVAKKAEVPVDLKSAFFMACDIRAQQALPRVDVDMLKFRYDYVFSMAELQLLQENLKPYVARAALEEMKAWDKLGSQDAPVPLTFLKYLIDSQNHQGLYNLTGVLGEKFWVFNDVDLKISNPTEYVELRNDASTGNAWQLFVLMPE